MSRIGIYGGTFNPIHNTHIDIAIAAKEQFKLDKLFFLVAGEPPHKNTSDAVNPFCRLDMVKLAVENIDGFYVDDRELHRAGKSYSYLTLEEYSKEYQNDELFFIMGSDSFLAFKNWVKPEIISSYATILVAPRLGDDFDRINSVIEEYKTIFHSDFFVIDYKANGISSSEVRDCINNKKNNLDISEDVYQYIINHHLYSNLYNNDDVTYLIKEMKDELKTNRFIHTIGVAETAYTLALKWNYPAYNAMVAGVLHDCAKCLSDNKRLEICKKNNISITSIEKKYPHLLHGKVGAYLAKNKYQIEDEQIEHAISIHTTGEPNMNLLDKIIFVADYIEPGRDKQPRLNTLRKIAYEDLDLCVFMILEDTVSYLNETPDSIDQTTIDTYNFYKKMRGI